MDPGPPQGKTMKLPFHAAALFQQFCRVLNLMTPWNVGLWLLAALSLVGTVRGEEEEAFLPKLFKGLFNARPALPGFTPDSVPDKSATSSRVANDAERTRQLAQVH